MNRFKRTTKNHGNGQAGLIQAIGLENLYYPSGHPFSRFAAGLIESSGENRRLRGSDMRVINR